MSNGCHECAGAAEGVPVGVPVVVTSHGAALPTPVGTGAGGGEVVSLTSLRPGQTARVQFTRLEAGDADLLRAMGLRSSARVRLCRLGEPCIIEVLSGSESCGRKGGCACRIGLARPLADNVLVGSIEG